VENDNQDN